MRILRSIRNFLHHNAQSARISAEIRAGIDNQSDLLNRKMNELIEGVKRQTEIINRRLGALNGETIMQQGSEAALSLDYENDINNGYQAPPKQAFEVELQKNPLLFARKTYNTNHPSYDAHLVRNYPGKVFNHQNDPQNPVYDQLKKLMRGDEIAEKNWNAILKASLEEAKSVPHSEQVFERKEYVEKYIADLEAKYGAFYRPGWVNLEDALFLYWVVRQLKPKVIVQTGVCNGLSSAFMMLALAKNGSEGTLHVVDMPPVFESNNPAWHIKNKVYGVTIPEGKTSGWLVPDAYRDRFEVLNGDAKDLLPGLLAKLGKIDMFYHDSDHTYDHMMFEFDEAKKYLTKSGVVVSDDISWNASLWDFADQYQVPAYNYRGSMGIACF